MTAPWDRSRKREAWLWSTAHAGQGSEMVSSTARWRRSVWQTHPPGAPAQADTSVANARPEPALQLWSGGKDSTMAL
jgi:hypothetical protein